MSVQFANNASTTLFSGITNLDTTIAVVDASTFPSLSGGEFTYVTLANPAGTTLEIVKVTNITGNTMTVERGQDGTTAQAFTAGDYCQLRLTRALLSAATADQTGAEIKTAYEAELDTNAFTDADHSKLDGIEAGAEVNNISDINATGLTGAGDSSLHYHSTDRARANHTGTQTLSTISDVTSTAAELNILDGVTATTAELNILDGVTSTTAELNILDGVTATTAELNYVDGVTSAIQTQLDGKQAYDVDTAKLDVDQSWSGSQRGTPSVVTDGTLDLNTANNFKYTPAAADTLDFLNETAGQSGFVTVINTSGHTISVGAEVKKGASWDISTAGTYLVNYYTDGTSVYVSASEALS